MLTNLLEDDTGLLQITNARERTFLDFHLQESTPSAWIYFPTEDDPGSKYKFTSLEIKMSLD